jgi:hypothetical protein
MFTRCVPGDVYLLCSDGLYDMVDEAEIQHGMEMFGANLELLATQLIQMANDNGGEDNISVVVVKVLHEFPAARWRLVQTLVMAQLRTKKAMAKLILSMDGLVLKEIHLRKEHMSIGRKAHNDIQIDNMAISGEHAAVVTILNDSFLEDLNSTNGTLVNGQPVKKHFLKDGDVIELGKYKMKYLAEAVASGETSEYEKSTPFRSEPLQVVYGDRDAMTASAQQGSATAPALPGAAIGGGDCPATTGLLPYPRRRIGLPAVEWPGC